MGIASLGSFAGGLTTGINNGLAIAGMAEDRAFQREQRDRARKLQQRQDSELSALDEANAQGAAVLKRYQEEWEKSRPVTLGGTTEDFRPTPQMILEAGRARTDALLRKMGPTEAWAKAWSADEAMRGMVRQQAAQRVKQSLMTGADPTNAVREFFETLDDGTKVTNVTLGKGPDGKPIVQVQRSNRYSGEAVQPLELPAEQLAHDLDMMAANPNDIAKKSLEMTLEAYKHSAKLKQIEAEGAERRKTEEKKGEVEKGLEEAKQKNRLSLESVRGENARDVAKIKASGNRSNERSQKIAALAQERTSLDSDIRTLTSQLRDARPADRVTIQARLDEARRLAADVRRRLAELTDGGGDAPSRAPAPAAPRQQGLPPGLPPGSRQIGTSGGKPVYQTPDGKRFIEE